MASKNRIRIDLTSAQAVDFVNKLAEDDDFRAHLVESPAEVLWEYGIEASPQLFAVPIELPAKEEIRSMLESIAGGEFMTVQAGPALLFPIFCAVFPWPGLSEES